MAGLIVMVCLVMGVGHWLFTPPNAVLAPLAQLQWLPWLLLAGVIALLAGPSARQP